jgi:hypothetical protein
MSKKNLSKSAIEGGRTGFSKFERRSSTQYERAENRNLIAKSHNDPDYFDDKVNPIRDKASKHFNDKLNPVKKWLASRVGYSWNKTYSILKEEFNSRTVAGRHIIYDHILRDVWRAPDRTDRLAKYYSFYVDLRGILRKNPKYRQTNDINYQQLKSERIAIEQWLHYRLIGKVGNVLYWYDPTIVRLSINFDWYDGKYLPSAFALNPLNFIKGRRLSGKDIQFFTKLNVHHKTTLLKSSDLLTRCDCKLQLAVANGCNCEFKTRYVI